MNARHAGPTVSWPEVLGVPLLGPAGAALFAVLLLVALKLSGAL